MNPMSFEQLVTLVSVIAAGVTVALTIRRDTTADRSREEARAAERQAMSSKLDSIADMSRETRDTVRELNRSVNDHSQVLARHTEQITALASRIESVEARCERHLTGKE